MVLSTVVVALACGLSPATPAAATETWDTYGGWTGRSLPATGHFRTARIDGRWWLVTPEGHPFFSNGLNSVRPTGTIDRFGNSAYLTTVLAAYGSESAWATAQLPRFADWGVNTLGGWSTVDLFSGRMPYTVSLSLAGQDVSSGRFADFWSPAWEASVETAMAVAAAGRVNDPWLVGYFLDNELHWTRDYRELDQLDYGMERNSDAPGKVHLVAWLRARYADDFAAFAADFQSAATTWETLPATVALTDRGPGAQRTRDAWSGEVAERFFAVTAAALEAADPNHLNLGTRFYGQLIVPEVLDAAARYVDVVSINWYELRPAAEALVGQVGPAFLPTADTLASHRQRVDLPLLISEFGWRATDSGLPNSWPPLQVVLDTQSERGERLRNFGQCLANTGSVVGAHWFGMVDQPAVGRPDGENSNWGLVTEGDVEYGALTAAMADVRAANFAPLTDPGWVRGPCTPMGPQTLAPSPAPQPGNPHTTAGPGLPVAATQTTTRVVPAFTG